MRANRVKFRSAYISVVTEITDISVNIPNFDYVMEFAFSEIIGMFERWYGLVKPIEPQDRQRRKALCSIVTHGKILGSSKVCLHL